MINYRLKIDFSDSKFLASDICFVSGDVKSSTLHFEFYDNGKRVDISGYTLSVRAKRSDGVVVASAGKIENNTAIFIPESNLYAVPGEVYMEIALSDATGKYATTKVIVAEVIEGLGEAAIEGADNLNVYVTLLNEVVAAKDEAKSAADDASKAASFSLDASDIAVLAKEETKKAQQKAEESKDLANEYCDAAKKSALRAETAADKAVKIVDGSAFSNAIKESGSGAVIRFDDVCPIEHAIKVNISGDDIVNMSRTKVHTFGKNIFGFDESFNLTKSGVSVDYDCETQIFTLNGTYAGGSSTLLIPLQTYLSQNTNYNIFKLDKSKMITVTVECIGGTVSQESGTNSILLTGADTVGYSGGNLAVTKISQEKQIKSLYPAYSYITNMYFHIANAVTFTGYKIRLQVELGEKSTKYEKYKRVTYSANADGTADVLSISPTMTISAPPHNVENGTKLPDGTVIVKAECNKDLNKALEKLQNAIISLGGNV